MLTFCHPESSGPVCKHRVTAAPGDRPRHPWEGPWHDFEPKVSQTGPHCFDFDHFSEGVRGHENRRVRGGTPRELWGTLQAPCTRRPPMATLTMPFCLEMLTFGHPESSGALCKHRVTVPFCLEMLTFCHPESSGALCKHRVTVPFWLEMLTFGHPESSGALCKHRATVPFCLGNAYILPPRELWASLQAPCNSCSR